MMDMLTTLKTDKLSKLKIFMSKIIKKMYLKLFIKLFYKTAVMAILFSTLCFFSKLESQNFSKEVSPSFLFENI